MQSTPALNSAPAFSSTPPTKLPGGGDVKPGLTYIYAPSVTDKDAADQVTVTMVSAPRGTTFENSILRWVPTLDQGGTTQSFTLNATDGKQSTLQTWSVSAGIRNPPSNVVITPVGTANPVELHSFTWTLAFQDEDAASVQVGLPHPTGMTYNAAARTLTWTPPAGSAGTDQLLVSVTNNVGLSTQQFLSITIDRNQGPTLTYAGPANPSAVEGDYFTAPFTIIDPNGDAIPASGIFATATYQGQVLSPAPTLTWDPTNSRATVAWMPTPNMPYRGHAVGINLYAADALGASNSLSTPLLVNPNLPPVFTADAGNPTSIVEGSFLSLQFLVSSPAGIPIDPNSLAATITYQGLAVNPHPSLTWDGPNGKATVTWTPNLQDAYVGHAVTLALTAADTRGARNTQNFTLAVTQDQPPAITADPSNVFSVAQGGFLSLLFSVVDPEGDAIATDGVSALLLYQGVPLSPGPSLSWDPRNHRALVEWSAPNPAPYAGKTITLRMVAVDFKGASTFKDFPISVTP